jgi:hypothetical protein
MSIEIYDHDWPLDVGGIHLKGKQMDPVNRGRALVYPLEIIGKELDTVSPELRALLRLALAGANGEPSEITVSDKQRAAARVNEALITRTADAAELRQKLR